MKTIANDADRKFDANLTSFVGILSVRDAFLVLKDFRIKFTSLDVTCLAEGNLLLKTQMNFHTHINFNFDHPRMIFILLIIICSAAILLSKYYFSQTIFSGFKPLDRFTMLI